VNIHGPDISFYQDDNNTPQKVDFQKMKVAGASFVILRAGQNTWIDQDFKDYYAAAKAAGLPRGVYWFYDSRSTPMSQAIICTSQIDGDTPELGVWADFEENYGGAYKGWHNWRLFCQALDTKFDVGIYTAPYYWMLNRPADPGALDYFKNKPLWIANYNVTSPLVPGPWTTWLFWQYTSSGDGLRYGVESREIDLNYFNGDEQTFRNYFSLGEPTVPPQQEQPMPYMKVTATALNLRSSAGVQTSPDNDLGAFNLIANDIIEGGELVYVSGAPWRQVLKIWRGGSVLPFVPSPTGEYWAAQAFMVPVAFEPPAEPEPDPEIGIPDYLVAHFANGTEKKYYPE
jgi:lysozyme